MYKLKVDGKKLCVCPCVNRESEKQLHLNFYHTFYYRISYRCLGLKERHYERGACGTMDVCSHEPCDEGEVCVPRSSVCLDPTTYACRQFECGKWELGQLITNTFLFFIISSLFLTVFKLSALKYIFYPPTHSAAPELLWGLLCSLHCSLYIILTLFLRLPWL